MTRRDLKRFYCQSKEYFYLMEKKHDRNFYLPIINLLKKKNINLKDKNVLDVGSGTGKFIRILKKEFKYKFEATGVDISIHGKSFHKGMNFIQGDAHNLPFEENTFNTVFSIDVLASVKDPKKVIKEMYRVTENDGYILIRSINFLPYSIFKKLNYFTLLKCFRFTTKTINKIKKSLTANNFIEREDAFSKPNCKQIKEEFSKFKGKILSFETWTKGGLWGFLNKLPLIKYFGTVNLILFRKTND